MGNIGKFLTESGLKGIKESFKVANDMLQSFSLNDIGKALDEAQNRLKGEFDRFVSQIKNFTDKYTVEVPFNTQTEIISYSIEGNAICITVKAKDNSSTSNKIVELPEDVDLREMTHSYDSERHIMEFKFKKIN